MPGLASWLVAMGMTAQMPTTYRTIMPTSDPLGYSRALLVMVGGGGEAGQYADGSCRPGQGLACLDPPVTQKIENSNPRIPSVAPISVGNCILAGSLTVW